MKKSILFLVALMVTTLTYAQSISPELLGIPTEVYNATENVVIEQKTYGRIELVPVTRTTIKNGVKTVTKSHMVRFATTNVAKYGSSLAKFSYYGMNLVNDYLNTYRFDYNGQNDSAYVMTSHNQEAYIVRVDNSWRMHVVSHPKEYSCIENGPVVNGRSQKVTNKYSREYVDSLCQKNLKMTLVQAEEKVKWTFHGTEKDPSVYVTSIFCYASFDGTKVTNQTMINGKHYSQVNYGSLITAQGKRTSIKFQWRYYNSCNPLGTVDSDMTGYGNESQCGKSIFYSVSEQGSKETSITFGDSYSYNSSSNSATMDYNLNPWVVLYLGEEPITGKETNNQCYIDLTTGVVYTFVP